MTPPLDHSAPVRVALVGLGNHGHTIQYAAEQATGIQVVAVYDVDEAECRTATMRFGCMATASYEALLAQDDLDAVILATPNQLHRAQAEAALQSGRDVFVEKPLAHTLADGTAMMETALSAQQILMVGHNMRFGQAARQAKRLIEEGCLGEVVSVDIHFSADSAKHLETDAWRLRPEHCSLLPIMQLGIHAIDLVHYWLDPIEEVYASTRSVATSAPVVDSVAATFRTTSGVHGTLVSNYCTEVIYEYRITGTEGTLRGTPHVLDWQPSGTAEDQASERYDFSDQPFASYIAELEAFARAVRLREPPETDGIVGLQALAVVEALRCSSDQHTPQRVQALLTPSAQ